MSKQKFISHDFQCGPDYKCVAELDAGHDIVSLTIEPTPELSEIRFTTDIVVRPKDTMEDVFVRYLNYLYLGNNSVWDALYEGVNIIQNEFNEDEYDFS